MSEAALGIPVQAEVEPFGRRFRADLFRHFVYHPRASVWRKLALAAQVEGIWASFVYRFGRALRTRSLPAPVSAVAWFAYRFLEVVVRLWTGIHLDVDAQIGPGFYVGHHGSIFVGPGTRIGRNCSIGQMCYLSAAAGPGSDGAPVVGDRVYLGPGSKVIGAVHIGDGAAIGANAVILDPVPPNAVMVGNPGRRISFKGSADLIYLGEGTPPLTGLSAREAMGR
jgi:serine O-acetyltransferase